MASPPPEMRPLQPEMTPSPPEMESFALEMEAHAAEMASSTPEMMPSQAEMGSFPTEMAASALEMLCFMRKIRGVYATSSEFRRKKSNSQMAKEDCQSRIALYASADLLVASGRPVGKDVGGREAVASWMRSQTVWNCNSRGSRLGARLEMPRISMPTTCSSSL